MSGIIPADLVEDVRDLAGLQLRDLLPELAQRLKRADGTTYGDVKLTRPQRMEAFVDRAQRGVYDALRVVKPELLQREIDEYLRDVRESEFERQAS